jgi:hypothetical protein
VGWRSSIAAFGAYAAWSVVLFGRGVVAAPDARVVGDGGSDKTISMWALEWWPHALLHGRDPFSADVVWAPHGMDLAWIVGIPGAAYAAAPLTYLTSPVVAYNVLALLAPASAAWGAFLLARWVTAAPWPAFLCGLLFGFSSYEISHTLGHLHLTLVVAIPLSALLVLRRAAGEITRTRYLLALTAVLAAQFLVSTEIFLMLVGVGVLALALAWWILDSGRRATLRRTAAETVLALGLTGVVVAPYLVHAFLLTGPSWAPTRSPFEATADLANVVVPRRWTWIQPPGADEIARRFTANPVESTAYLGLPLVAVVALFALRRGRSQSQRLLLALLAVLFVFSLGPWVRVAGTTVLAGPGQLFARVPVTESALPVRLTVFVSLLAALVCAIWLAERRTSIFRWSLAVLSVVALLPTPSTAFWTAEVERACFFADGHAQRLFRPDDVLLVLPYGRAGWSMLWQAEADFGYRTAGGRLGNLPPDEQRWLPLLRVLAGAEPSKTAADQLRPFLDEHDVDAIVVVPTRTRPSPRALVERLGVEAVRVCDALVYRLPTRVP